MDFNELQKHLNQVMQEQNSRSMPSFEGYSPEEMHHILNFTFSSKSPVKLQKLSDADYRKIPILNQVKYLANRIHEQGEIKLTSKGFLPTKLVADIYHQGFLKDWDIENGITKLYKESETMSVNITHILIDLSGITKKRNGKISLTKTGEKIIGDNYKLLKTILETFTTKFNWAYYDGFGDNQIGQLGFGFTLILLSKYGKKKRPDAFYAEKYFKAYPNLKETIHPSYDTVDNVSKRCYSLRTFDRFLDYFGVIDIEQTGHRFNDEKYITKTALFDKLIKVEPHKTR